MTREAIVTAAVDVLNSLDTPLHYDALTEAIKDRWAPEPGAKTKASFTVYSYCYQDSLEAEAKIVFLKRGVFGLKGKTYTAEQIGAQVPARRNAPKLAVPAGHQVAFIPENLTEKQREAIAKLGIQLA